MTRPPFGPLLLLALCASFPARADESKPYRAAALHAARTLALVAADQGLDAARALAGGRLPSELREALAGIAQSPRRADLRDLPSLKLKAALLDELVAEVPEADAALTAWAEDAGAHAERELRACDQRARALLRAVRELRTKVEGKLVGSRRAARSEPEGPLLLLCGAQGVLLRHLLSRAGDDPLAVREVLLRFFDRPADALAEGLLRVLPGVARSPVAGALGPRAPLRSLTETIAKRLRGARDRVLEVVAQATVATTALRDEESRRVLQGDRAPHLAEALRRIKAYRRQFDEPPALRARPEAWGVYEDVRDRRLHFWIPGEGRWVRGHERVDPLDPVQQAFLASPDPEVQREVAHARTLAVAYALFEARAETSFAEGWSALEARFGEAAARLARLRERARAAGLEGDSFEERLAGALGVNARALASPRAALDRVLSSAAWRGLGPTLELLSALSSAADALRERPVWGASLRCRGVAEGARVDFVWELPAGIVWLAPPPARAAAGQRVELVGLGTGAVRVRAFAQDGADCRVGEARLAAGADAALELAPGDPALVASEEGVRQLPLEGPRLRLERADGGLPLRPAPGGGALDPAPGSAGGEVVVVGRDTEGAERARLSLRLPPERGVLLAGNGGPLFWTRPDAEVEGHFQVGGKPGKAPGFAVRGAHGELLERLPGGERARWKARVPPGRYELGPADEPVGTPFGVATEGPRVDVVRSPFGAPCAEALRAGEAGFLRVSAWPALNTDEVLEVRWRVGTSEAATRPRAGLPFEAILLPVVTSKAGEFPVAAEVRTGRGSLRLRTVLRVEEGLRPARVELRATLGRGAVAAGEEGLLAVEPALEGAEWTLLGPAGPAPLQPRFDGLVPLRLDPQAPLGEYTVWVAGTSKGQRAFATLSFDLYRAPALALRPPAHARVGDEVLLRVDPPAGFRPPFEIRRGNQAWRAGTSLRVRVLPENDLWIALRDARGHTARGRLTFRGQRALPQPEGAGPRFGIAANAKDRRIFAAPYDLLLRFKQSETLPPNLAVLEYGPLSAERVRDRIFQTVPYDGPPQPGSSQDVYRSVRWWEHLQPSARERLAELKVPPGTPFSVRNSPAPGGEETLADLVGRYLDEHGGWTFRLVSVKVRADGASPAPLADDPKVRVRLLRRAIDRLDIGRVDRVAVPGPLGPLELLLRLPDELSLDRTERLFFGATARREDLAPRPYPADWHLLASKAFLVTELEVEARFGGKTLARKGYALGKAVADLDATLVFEHLGPVRNASLAGQPRTAERHRIRLALLGAGDPTALEHAFAALSPGRLDNAPEELHLVVRARALRGVGRRAWPAGKPLPTPVVVQGVPLYLEREAVPEPSVLLEARYVRAAPGGESPPPEPKTPAGVLVAEPLSAALPPLEESLKAARAALATGDGEAAEAAARAALASAAADPRPWALLADAAWQRARQAEARDRARWSLELGPTERAWLVLAEVALSRGELAEAREAQASAAGLAPRDPTLKDRWQRVARALR
ncbi:MAG: hypothetical protein D6731_25850 [Planctomycetota bacterium]|nr:MAG: hypothetical protein D6731_25850 [Planctomycetota bacterium]